MQLKDFAFHSLESTGRFETRRLARINNRGRNLRERWG
jgi:hypothetical protein